MISCFECFEFHDFMVLCSNFKKLYFLNIIQYKKKVDKKEKKNN